MPNYNQNPGPIEYICVASIFNSLFVGAGGLAYCAFANKNISSIKTPMKYIIVSTNTLGGAACGAVVGGLSGFVLATLGTSGSLDKELNNKIVNSWSLSLATIGGGIGGISGLCFGLSTNKWTYDAIEKISLFVPRQVIMVTTIVSAGIVSYKFCKSIINERTVQKQE